jgi:small neutral amino acid transporter SnatA (MarC family)
MVAGAVLLIIGALLPVVNPLGDAPLFLAMTPGFDEALRALLARRIAVYSFALLLGSMLLGGFVLRIFGLSIFLTYRYAERISARIGPTGMTVLLRLSAFITLCIGVAITWNGVRSLLEEIGIGR